MHDTDTGDGGIAQRNHVVKVPLHRPGQASEVANAVVFIVESDFFTGRCIDLDGGLRM